MLGIPTPALSSALAFYDGYRCKAGPANLLQAQRDYFGAHTFSGYMHLEPGIITIGLDKVVPLVLPLITPNDFVKLGHINLINAI